MSHPFCLPLRRTYLLTGLIVGMLVALFILVGPLHDAEVRGAAAECAELEEELHEEGSRLVLCHGPDDERIERTTGPARPKAKEL
jgi:hypothetical protein